MLMRRVVLILWLSGLLTGPALPSTGEAGSEWWEESTSGIHLDRRDIDISAQTAVRTKWDEGYIEVKAGATADRRVAVNRAQARSMALKAARHLAYEKLAETVEGLTLTGDTIIKKETLKDSTLRVQIQAKIKGARVVSEAVQDLPDGSVWAEVVVGLRLNGPEGLTSALTGWAAAQQATAYRPNPAYVPEEHYTGLIVEASGLGFSPALTPRLLATDDQAQIYGPHSVDPHYLETAGLVGYTDSLLKAKADGRVGPNPLIVRAQGVAGERKGDLLITRQDAERILAADRQSGILKRAAVIIVVGKGPIDLLKEGRRYALLIGINEYANSQDSRPIRPLRFAANDARDLATLLVQNGGYAPEDIQLLLNDQATRAAIYAALRSLRSKVREEDTVLIFFSGHGTVGTAPDGTSHYYLVPSDGRIDNLYQTAIRDDAFEELVGQLLSKKLIVVLDACHSGGIRGKRIKGVTNPLVHTPPARDSFMEAGEGRVILAASRPEQVSIEDDQVRHGVFTHFLLKALEGKADFDRNNEITVLEVYQYLSTEVRAYTQRVHGFEQRPVLEVRGMSGELILAAAR